MKNSNIKYAILGFIGGILAAIITGLINIEINRQNKVHEDKILEREETESIVDEYSNLQLAYEHLKYDLRNNVICETTYMHLIELNKPLIKILGKEQVTLNQKYKLTKIVSELEFITKNHCDILKMIEKNKHHGKVVSMTVDGREIKGYLFDGNLKITDSLFATLSIEFLIDKKN